MQNDTSITMLNTSLIVPNKYQPRKIFDETELTKLAESIKLYGIINPILVRKKEDKYEIIAGERRFRATQMLGLKEIPAIIKNADEQQMAELALIENIQRKELSPIEEAKSYEEIMKIGNQTQQSLAKKLGKSQSAIANKIRLLSLPQEIQDALSHKMISERHARSILTIEDKNKQLEVLNKIISEKLTVKETEQLIKSKEIDEEEIKKAINDLMKSLNIEDNSESNKEEKKEDDNMINGNFFPNYDNNNNNNNNASLNMMNMQSMNQQQPLMPEQEMVMPTIEQPIQPQVVPPQVNMQSFVQQPTDFSQPIQEQPMPEQMQNPQITPLFNTTGPNNLQNTDPPQQLQSSMPMVDEPLFNPNVVMPTQNATPIEQPQIENNVSNMASPTIEMTQPVSQSVIPENQPFEVPVTETQQQPLELPTINKLEQLQELLNVNGYQYKTYSNDQNDCIIIELSKN